MTVLLDLNVVLDVFLARTQWLAEAAAILDANSDRRITAYLSASSLPTLFYIVRRNADQARALQVIAESLDSFEIVAVDRSALEQAFSFPGSDFEDNLQIACAVAARLDGIITRDVKGFAGSPVPGHDPC